MLVLIVFLAKDLVINWSYSSSGFEFIKISSMFFILSDTIELNMVDLWVIGL